MTSLPRSVLLLAAASVLIGCAGYRLGGVPPQQMEGIRSLAVPTFSNNTLEPRIDVLFTNAVIGELQTDGTYAIGSQSGADAILQGTIRTIERYQLRSSRTNTLRPSELGIRVYLDYVILRNDGSRTRLLEGQASGESRFFPQEEFELSERPAFADAARDAALRLTANITEGF